jgi:hypothetical protein
MTENTLKAGESKVGGDAARIPAALKAQEAVLRATIHVTRKVTGVIETFEIVGTPDKKEQ